MTYCARISTYSVGACLFMVFKGACLAGAMYACTHVLFAKRCPPCALDDGYSLVVVFLFAGRKAGSDAEED